jgi:hypothetical protein
MEDKMSSAVEFLARNPATNPDVTSPAHDLAAFEKRIGTLERTSRLERRVAELERQNAKTQELASGLLSLLWVPAALVAFSPQNWIAWFAGLYVVAVGYELMKRLFRFLMS